MSETGKTYALFAMVVVLIIGTGVVQSWNSALFILNMGLISAIMALGVNLQWGIAGLLNVGIMGFVALGGLATVLVSMDPVPDAWDAGGPRLFLGLALGAASILAVAWPMPLPKGWARIIGVAIVAIIGFQYHPRRVGPREFRRSRR